MLEPTKKAPAKPPRWRLRARSVALGLAAVTAGAVAAVTVATPAQAALRDAATTANRFIGYAANAQMLCNNQAACTSGSNATYRNLAATEFNQVTPENVMKWETIEPNDDQYNFAPADGIVAFAAANGQQVHGHTLVWHSQTPGYVQGMSAAAMRAEMQEHITALVGRYANNPAVVSWDVVNEAISDNNGQLRQSFWLNTLGVSYIADAFRFARAADSNADLCINDYSIDGINAKSNALFNLVQDLLADNVPITCVGFQGHLVINQIPGDMQQNLQRFANLGLDVRITELDIRIPLPADAQELQVQANDFATVVNACRAVSACTGITTWGIDDGSSWLPNSCCGGGNEAAALLWDANFQQKPAYAAVNTALGGGNQQVPGTPGTPSATNVTSSSLTLSWGASSGTVSNYQIERATGATSTNFTQVGTSTTTSFNDSGLAANTTYRYRVRATNSAGNSAYSSITNVTTGGGTGGSCTFRVDSWDNGYVAYVTVNGPRSGWSMPFTMGTNNTIINSWNASISPSTGTNRTATNMSYNGNLSAGQSTQWGFQSTRPSGGPLPTFPDCTAE